jgi:hypothetical protein
MYSLRFDGKETMKVLNNLVAYSNGFITESKAKQGYVASKMADLSITGFYEFLDTMARMHPGMLHHVYEWGQVGDPAGRLYDLKKVLTGNSAEISADFLQSNSTPEGGNEPFFNKAEIMEDGVSVVINEVQAKALFFQVDGEEFFRSGPIFIANPGGAAVRGSFVTFFEQFYNEYFERVYLESIKFYDSFRNPQQFSRNFRSAMKSGNAGAIGRRTALSWITQATGGVK